MSVTKLRKVLNTEYTTCNLALDFSDANSGIIGCLNDVPAVFVKDILHHIDLNGLAINRADFIIMFGELQVLDFEDQVFEASISPQPVEENPFMGAVL